MRPRPLLETRGGHGPQAVSVPVQLSCQLGPLGAWEAAVWDCDHRSSASLVDQGDFSSPCSFHCTFPTGASCPVNGKPEGKLG